MAIESSQVTCNLRFFDIFYSDEFHCFLEGAVMAETLEERVSSLMSAVTSLCKWLLLGNLKIQRNSEEVTEQFM